MKRVLIIILLASWAFLIIRYFAIQDNYDVINLENIKEIQLYSVKSNKETVITNSNDIANFVSVFKKININKKSPDNTYEEEIIYQFFVIPDGYYPGGPISITQNHLICNENYYSLENAEFETLLSSID